MDEIAARREVLRARLQRHRDKLFATLGQGEPDDPVEVAVVGMLAAVDTVLKSMDANPKPEGLD
jgi:hypothetical protein